jgi:hypothetical protein
MLALPACVNSRGSDEVSTRRRMLDAIHLGRGVIRPPILSAFPLFFIRPQHFPTIMPVGRRSWRDDYTSLQP